MDVIVDFAEYIDKCVVIAIIFVITAFMCVCVCVHCGGYSLEAKIFASPKTALYTTIDSNKQQNRNRNRNNNNKEEKKTTNGRVQNAVYIREYGRWVSGRHGTAGRRILKE